MHDRDNDHLGALARRPQAVGEGAERRVGPPRDQGRLWGSDNESSGDVVRVLVDQPVQPVPPNHLARRPSRGGRPSRRAQAQRAVRAGAIVMVETAA